jgi:hypothetical protein
MCNFVVPLPCSGSWDVGDWGDSRQHPTHFLCFVLPLSIGRMKSVNFECCLRIDPIFVSNSPIPSKTHRSTKQYDTASTTLEHSVKFTSSLTCVFVAGSTFAGSFAFTVSFDQGLDNDYSLIANPYHCARYLRMTVPSQLRTEPTTLAIFQCTSDPLSQRE